MKNIEILDIKERINRNMNARHATDVSLNFNFEDSLELLKEQYLEIELGLQQLEKGNHSEAFEFINSVKSL